MNLANGGPWGLSCINIDKIGKLSRVGLARPPRTENLNTNSLKNEAHSPYESFLFGSIWAFADSRLLDPMKTDEFNKWRPMGLKLYQN